MRRTLLLILGLLVSLTPVLQGQRGGGLPRRLAEPQTIYLAAEARVEFLKFTSAALGRPMGYSVYLPPSYRKEKEKEGSFPVIYFLHGMNNDETSWCVERYGNFPAAITELITSHKSPEFVMVHPRGESSFYTDSADGTQKFEEYIRVDLLQEVERRFRVSTASSGRAIVGTSMGGYGALKIAFKYPQLFAAVAAGSPIVLLGDNPMEQLRSSSSRFGERFGRILGRIYGNPFDQEHWRQNSLERLAGQSDLGGLQVLLLYGKQDRYNRLIPMEQGIRRLNAILQERQVQSRLEVFEAENHGWSLLFNRLESVIHFLTASF